MKQRKPVGWLGIVSLVIGCAVLLYLAAFWSTAGSAETLFDPVAKALLVVNCAGVVIALAGLLVHKSHRWFGALGLLLNAAPPFIFVWTYVRAILELFQGH